MHILIDPRNETISTTDFMEETEILNFLQDEKIGLQPLGKLLAVTGANAPDNPNEAATILKAGDDETVTLHGPAILMAQSGYFIDDGIAASLVEDLRQTARFRPVNEKQP